MTPLQPNPTCRLWLARRDGKNVELVDGCHDGPEGVAKAAKLHKRIFNNEGPWVMVEIHPTPDLDPPINEDSAQICADLIAGRFPTPQDDTPSPRAKEPT